MFPCRCGSRIQTFTAKDGRQASLCLKCVRVPLGKPDLVAAVRECDWCENTFIAKSMQKHCSRLCSYLTAYVNRGAVPHVNTECKQCGKWFATNHPFVRLCSRRCTRLNTIWAARKSKRIKIALQLHKEKQYENAT